MFNTLSRIVRLGYRQVLLALFPVPQGYDLVPRQPAAHEPLQPRSLSITPDVSMEQQRGLGPVLYADFGRVKGETLATEQYPEQASTEGPIRWIGPSTSPTEETPA